MTDEIFDEFVDQLRNLTYFEVRNARVGVVQNGEFVVNYRGKMMKVKVEVSS